MTLQVLLMKIGGLLAPCDKAFEEKFGTSLRRKRHFPAHNVKRHTKTEVFWKHCMNNIYLSNTRVKAAISVIQNTSVFECLVTLSAGKLLFTFVAFSNSSYFKCIITYGASNSLKTSLFSTKWSSEWTLAFMNNTGILQQHDSSYTASWLNVNIHSTFPNL